MASSLDRHLSLGHSAPQFHSSISPWWLEHEALQMYASGVLTPHWGSHQDSSSLFEHRLAPQLHRQFMRPLPRTVVCEAYYHLTCGLSFWPPLAEARSKIKPAALGFYGTSRPPKNDRNAVLLVFKQQAREAGG